MKARLAMPGFGLAVFLVTAVLCAPMDRIHGWLAPTLSNGPVTLRGVEGVLLRGEVARIEVRGQPALQDLDWRLRPWHLLLGQLRLHLAGGAQGSLLDGEVAVVPSGTLSVSDLRLTLPLQAALRLAGQPNLPVQGQAGLQLDHLRLRRQWPDRARGVLTVRGLGWKLGREPVILGDYEARLDEEAGGIVADIGTLDGALDVTGQARLTPERGYDLQLQMRPKPDAPPLVSNLVRNLGQPDAQGWYQLRRQGSVPAATETAP